MTVAWISRTEGMAKTDQIHDIIQRKTQWRFPNRLAVVHERKRRVKDNGKVRRGIRNY